MPVERRQFLYLFPFRKLVPAILALLVAAASFEARAETVTVFAASSMKDALEDAASAFSDGDTQVVFSFAASSILARQVAEGAPADIYISADTEWAAWLSARVDAPPPVIIAGNELVVVAYEGKPAASFGEALGSDGRIAIGDPGHVPAGRYARQALDAAGLWATVGPRAILAENVRVALAYAQRGEVDAAIVYRSDAVAATGVKEIWRIDPLTHDPIVYPAMVLGDGQKAAAFLDFLMSEEGQGILLRNGFAGRPK